MSHPDPLLIDMPEALMGGRVIVRPWRAGDGMALFEAVQESRDHIHPWLPWGPSHTSVEYSEALVRRFRARWEMRDNMPMSIWDRESGHLVGGCGLHRIDWNIRSFEIGYWVRSSAQGHGYITESARLLTGLAFDTLDANRVFIRVVVENLRSAAVPKRIGFVHEGTHRNAIMDAEGRLRDLLVFGLTPEEWQALNP